MGIRFWAQWYTRRRPTYEVFEYIGKDPNKGMFYFRSRTEKTIIARTFYQLNQNGFHAFVLDYARSEARLEQGGKL